MQKNTVSELQWDRLKKPDSVHWLTLKHCTVKDGDTIAGTYTTGIFPFQKHETITIRLAGINCPETNEAYGTNATNATKRFCEGKTVRIEYAKDRHGSWVMEGSGFGRLIGFVWRHGRCLNVELVRQGLAHLYSSPDWMTSPRKKALIRTQRSAERHHRNIWKKASSGVKGRILLAGAIGFTIGLIVCLFLLIP